LEGRIPLRTHIKDTKIRRGDNLGDQCFWARLVDHPQPEPVVQLGAVARVSVAQQPEQVSERLGDGVELVGGHPLRRRLGEAEPGLGCFLDRGGLGDPSGDERWIAARVEGRPVSADLPASVGDGLAQLFDLPAVAVGGERGAVLRFATRRMLSLRFRPVSSSRRNSSTGWMIASSRR
jgi:hypothetical protein